MNRYITIIKFNLLIIILLIMSACNITGNNANAFTNNKQNTSVQTLAVPSESLNLSELTESKHKIDTYNSNTSTLENTDKAIATGSNSDNFSTVNAISDKSSNPTNKETDSNTFLNQKSLDEQYLQGFNIFLSGKYQDAISIENNVIKKDPKYFKAYSVKGISLCYDGNFEKGMENIDKALQLKPDFGYGMFNKALAYELYEYYDDAILWYKKDLEIEKYPWSYYGIASIYGRRGDVNNTVKYLKLAFDLSPDTKKAALTEKDFNNVRNSIEFQHLFK